MLMLKFMLVSLVDCSLVTALHDCRDQIINDRSSLLVLVNMLRLLVLLPARFFAHVNNADVMEL